MIQFRAIVAGPVLAMLLCAVGVAGVAAQEQGDAQTQAEQGEGAKNIEKRLRRIEDEIIDMRAMIGALQSFASDGQNATPPDSFSTSEASPDPRPLSGDSFDTPGNQPSAPATTEPSNPQISQLEIQIQALSAQLSEAIQRLARLEQAVGLSEDDAAGSDTAAEAQLPDAAETVPDPDVSGFGTTTVEQPSDIAGDAEPAPSWDARSSTAEADAAGNPDARALYTQAYDALLTQDYGAARNGFETFINAYPDDPLINKARYWLADAAFAEGDYVAAANHLVKVYNSAPTGENAEEALLKLAIALRRLDRTDSACDALSRLEGRIDGMSETFRGRVQDERSRSGCS